MRRRSIESPEVAIRSEHLANKTKDRGVVAPVALNCDAKRMLVRDLRDGGEVYGDGELLARNGKFL